MPDTDSSPSLAVAGTDRSNLPVPVPAAPAEPARDGEGVLARLMRALFGWKAGSIRQDLEVVLENGTPADTGFSPQERTMLQNILELRERRVEGVMVPRADIVAGPQDTSIGEPLKGVARAGHSARA